MTTLAELVESGWLDDLATLRKRGWTVAVHNDYVQGGERYTFWLFTHAESGRFAKGEGSTDAVAVYQARMASRIDDGDLPKACSRCGETLIAYSKGGGARCDRCWIYFEHGRWWYLDCDEYHSHSMSCVRAVVPVSGSPMATGSDLVWWGYGRLPQVASKITVSVYAEPDRKSFWLVSPLRLADGVLRNRGTHRQVDSLEAALVLGQTEYGVEDWVRAT